MANIIALPSNSRRGSRADIMSPQRSSIQTDSYSKNILLLAKQLKSNCDKILDRSVPFVIDSGLLWSISEALNHLTTSNRLHEPDPTTQDFEDQLLFLADFFEQTPSLVIVLAESCPLAPSSLDLALFGSLEFLELRKVRPQSLNGLNSHRRKLRRFKCSRNVEAIDEVFQICSSSEQASLSSNPLSPNTISTPIAVWSELREIDCSFNRITQVDTAALQCTPALELLNLSRNRITTIDSSLARILQTLTVLNLNFNQLTTVPPTPPNLKILLLSNNYIPTLVSRYPLPESLEMLDVSQNVISDDREIESIRRLLALKNLAFIGNPITYSSNYRKLVSSHLSRPVLKNKNFLLDQKKLSPSEVRRGLEAIIRPSPVITPMPFLCRQALSITASVTVGHNDRLADLRSLTQSIDSSSSSLRSACRKKAKIRELVILDSDDMASSSDSKIEAPTTIRSRSGRPKSQGSSGSSSSSIEEAPLPTPVSDEVIKATSEALQSIREKYGEEYWLFRQGGADVQSLLNLESKYDSSQTNKQSLKFSNSLPPTSKDASFYSALSETQLFYELSNTNSNSTILQVQEDEPTTPSDDESIKPLDDDFTTSSSDGTIFYPCESESISNSLDSSPAESLIQLELFVDPEGRSERFRSFEKGVPYYMVILDNFLYQLDSENGNAVVNKWDLKSLESLREEKRYEETESVQFEMTFDTRRKHLQQKYCVMPLKDFRRFQEKTNTFLQARTLQEFGEGFQCAKCDWAFSRGMANKKVVVTEGKIPTEVPLCPNPGCQSELLIPLDAAPPPETARSPPITVPTKVSWMPRMTSSPISGGLIGQAFGVFCGGKSLPTESKFSSDLLAAPPNSFSCQPTPNSQSPSSNTTNSNSNKKEPKSESDIETLSCDDSSSIEILPTKTTSSSGSDVAVVEEALELDVPEFACNTATRSLCPPMTDSTSSGSCTGSICTQYEKTITAAPSSGKPSLVSIAFTPISQPFKYDYEKFNQVDHRLLLHFDLNLFKHQEERFLGLVKVMVMTLTGSYLSLVIFSNRKVYFCKIIGPEGDKVESWLQLWKKHELNKLSKLDVLIGRHGLGLDFSGNYFALIFRDSDRTSSFIEFFLNEICGEFLSRGEIPPFVQDFSQTQKALMSPTNPIAYFGILQKASCRNTQGNDNFYSLSAVVLTNEELILVADLSCLVNRTSESVSIKHVRQLVKLREVESMEANVTFVRLVFQLDTVRVKWDLNFETENEKGVFLVALKNYTKEVPFIISSEPKPA